MNRWTGRVERTLAQEVPAAPEDVRSFYADLDNIGLVHPLVVSVRTVLRRETADGYEQTYRVTDRIPVGPLALRATYVAHLHVPLSGDISTDARQFPRVRLRGRVSFAQTGSGTLVTEKIGIEAPRPLLSLTVGKAVEAHAEMLAGMRRHFERTG
ncbi:MAG TPA: SRPBCC family protein [Mycobacterium sp.]|nr:SRPBCC family protein [Mycobacterium sp.]